MKKTKISHSKKNSQTKKSKISKRSSVKKSKKDNLASLAVKDKQAVIQLEHFLVDEQISYSDGFLENKVEQISGQVNQLGEERINSDSSLPLEEKKKQELLPQNEIKIYLNKEGRTIKKKKTYKQFNSAYLINLKEEEKHFPKFKKPPSSRFKSLFQPYDEFAKDFTDDNKFTIPATSLIKKKSLIEFLDEFGVKVHKWYKNLFKAKKKEKPAFTFVQQKRTEGFLVNLKFALNFALIALLLVLPIRGIFFYEHLAKTKNKVSLFSQAAWQEIKQGAEAATQADWQNAAVNFSTANNYFAEALVAMEDNNRSLMDIIKVIPAAGQKVTSAQNLLMAGKHLTTAAQNLAGVFSQTKPDDSLGVTTSDGLAFIQNDLTMAKEDLDQALNYLAKVDPKVLPVEYRDYLIEVQSKLPQLRKNLDQGSELFSLALDVLGHNSPKRFLFMFQNTNELRATGGFFGSLALVDIEDGKIINLEVPAGGSYDLKGYFTEKIISPEPLHLVGTAWEIWDANWWPDFPTSAKKITWFFEKSGWPSVDGVIAFNSSLIPELLKIVGNIEMPKYNKVLTPDDVVLALQHATLFEYDKEENQPKEIISDLMPILVERLLSVQTEQTLPLLLTLNEAFKNKDVQLYFADSSMQAKANNFGLTGELLPAQKDYLAVIDTNIAGGKTNGVIEQKINHYSYLQDDGSIIDTVAITRTHLGNPDDVFEKVNNVSYLRVYVPLDSQLIDVTGYNPPTRDLFKRVYENFYNDEYLQKIQGKVTVDPQSGTRINNELGKTVFGNWIQVEPGQSETITFSYRLPFKVKEHQSFFSKLLGKLKKGSSTDLATYSLLAQRQSGTDNVSLKSILFLPSNLHVKWLDNTQESKLVISDKGVDFTSTLDSDQYYAVVLEK
ncbi:DUF4012 domain-containing protein [Patescibacteria group bacterium]|nr:DUF4012 domain-containing protein [Patescibacteria group bacterium]